MREKINERAVGQAEKAWETMRSRSSGIKAKYTRRRKEGARKAASKAKGEQWKPEKVALLMKWQEEATPDVCAVCGDTRPFVQQEHHIEPNGERVVKLYANCRDMLRRSKDTTDLEEAHRGGSYFSKNSQE